MSSRIFFGWWVTIGFSVIVFLSTGIRFTVGPFLKPIVADLGLDRASFSAVVALAMFLYGAAMPLVGRAADRFGARPVLLAGSVVLGLSVGGTGLVTRLSHLYALYGVGMAVGLAMTGHVVATAVVARWFTRRRATALSLLSAAAMGGMSLLVPVATWLILHVGWRAAYGVLAGAAVIIIVPLALWVVQDRPETLGLAPDGGAVPPGAMATDEPRTAVAVAIRTRPFWQIGGALCTCGFSMSLLAAHGVPMLTDHGFHPMVASWAFAVLGGTNVVFAILLGTLADRVGSRPVLAAIYGGRAVVFAALFLVHDHTVAILAIAALGGATMAGTFAMSSTLTAEIFGRTSVGSVFGMMFLVHQTGAAAGSWLGGVSFEMTGGYGLAFAAACAILVGAALLTLRVDVQTRCFDVREVPGVAGGR